MKAFMIMLQNYIILLVLVHLSASIEEGRQRITIPCQANTEPGVKYRKITWYKVVEGSSVLTGLVLKDLNQNITILYKFANHSYAVGEDHSLQFLSNAAGENCGIYRCTLWPPLGHYIQEKDYEYNSADCTKPQIQQVRSSRGSDAPLKNHLKFFTVPCVVIIFAFVIFLLNLKNTNRAKEKADVKGTLVHADEKV